MARHRNLLALATICAALWGCTNEAPMAPIAGTGGSPRAETPGPSGSSVGTSAAISGAAGSPSLPTTGGSAVVPGSTAAGTGGAGASAAGSSGAAGTSAVSAAGTSAAGASGASGAAGGEAGASGSGSAGGPAVDPNLDAINDLFPPLSTPDNRPPSPDNPPECPKVAPENPVGDCAGLPIYVECNYGTYSCVCDWVHWLCFG